MRYPVLRVKNDLRSFRSTVFPERRVFGAPYFGGAVLPDTAMNSPLVATIDSEIKAPLFRGDHRTSLLFHSWFHG
ncbi:MAG TPA: hypothetical protein DEB39_14705 [Planctomycetaceae bacterium]|nr:hypothetical protein [Planctomycetaceae bacterium]